MNNDTGIEQRFHFIVVVKKTFCYSNVFFYNHLYHPISGFKTLDHAQMQGVGRRKNAAYMGVCEYFEEGHSTAIGC